jgi:hypothetical protein
MSFLAISETLAINYNINYTYMFGILMELFTHAVKNLDHKKFGYNSRTLTFIWRFGLVFGASKGRFLALLQFMCPNEIFGLLFS